MSQSSFEPTFAPKCWRRIFQQKSSFSSETLTRSGSSKARSHILNLRKSVQVTYDRHKLRKKYRSAHSKVQGGMHPDPYTAAKDVKFDFLFFFQKYNSFSWAPHHLTLTSDFLQPRLQQNIFSPFCVRRPQGHFGGSELGGRLHSDENQPLLIRNPAHASVSIVAALLMFGRQQRSQECRKLSWPFSWAGISVYAVREVCTRLWEICGNVQAQRKHATNDRESDWTVIVEISYIYTAGQPVRSVLLSHFHALAFALDGAWTNP